MSNESYHFRRKPSELMQCVPYKLKENKMKNANFSDFKLNEDLLKAIGMLNYESPTQVQAQVIPVLLAKRDVIVKSQTGSGKTAAFAIPICQMIDWEANKPQALVITPTRELAIQVKEDVFNIGRFKRLKVAAIFGKSSFYHQEKELKQKTHAVVGTPGRIIDHLERGTLDTANIKYLVLDEADEMLNMGFIDDVETIIAALPKERVTMLLSATMPADIDRLCKEHMNNPLRIEVEEKNPVAQRICQERYTVDRTEKLDLLKDILIVENPDSCIVFCNTQVAVDEVSGTLSKLKFTCMKIHGGMDQRDRMMVMNDFKKGYFRYLIATDVAARGIDIEDISLIINYDIPKDGESYVHRIGRTGRVSNTGRAVTFVTPDENAQLDAIENYTDKKIDLKGRPKKEQVNEQRAAFIEKTSTAPEIKKGKSTELDKEIMKLHINAGKKTKMRPVDIVGTLCNIDGMTADDIGIINILDVSTFVEILNNKGEMVFNVLQDMPIKGRMRTVSKADAN